MIDRRQIRVALAALLLLLFCLRATAQTRAPKGSYKITSGGRSVEIPFELIGNHLVVPVEVNGQRFHAALDTGNPAYGLVLFSSPIVDRLQLEFSGSAPVRGIGGNDEFIHADMAFGQTLKFPGLDLTEQSIIVLPVDEGRILDFVYEGKSGIIGYSFFGQFVVRIDFEKKIVTLIEPDAFEYEGAGSELPLTLKYRYPFTSYSVELDGIRLPTEFVVDLGSSSALMLNMDSRSELQVPSRAIARRVARGLSGELFGHIARIQQLGIGRYTLKGVTTAFSKGLSRSLPAMGKAGNLGTDVLRRFHVTFDYSQKRLILEPNRHFDEPFEADMSGLVYSRAKRGLFKVDGVIPNSAAEESGLKVDDMIFVIDNHPAKDLKSAELKELFQKPGRRISLELIRGEQRIKVKLELRRLI